MMRYRRVPASDLSHHDLVSAAAGRCLVELDDGRRATLIRWGGRRNNDRRSSITNFRVEWHSGNRASFAFRRLAAVLYDQPINQGGTP